VKNSRFLWGNQEFQRELKHLSVICITHRTASLEQVGHFHVDEAQQQERLAFLRDELGMEELMYLSTCNRVEFIFHGHAMIDDVFLARFYNLFFGAKTPVSLKEFHAMTEVYEGNHALEHLFRVAASLDSMVVGEREIITQVRDAFDRSRNQKLCSDNIRLVMRKTIETAKRVYTETDIARKPVSVVSLAYKALRDLNVDLDARVVIIGAGKTNRNMGKFLLKHGFRNFVVYNRTESRAAELARDLNGRAAALSELPLHNGGFDVLIACTSSTEPIVTEEIYGALLNGETGGKVIIDLAVPNEVHENVSSLPGVRYLEVESLQAVAAENLKSRQQEVVKCEQILAESLVEFEQMYQERQVERAMGAIPSKIKEIREHAMGSVFQRELNEMDESSREVLERMMSYFEKKYIGLPMKMAKDILIQNRRQ